MTRLIFFIAILAASLNAYAEPPERSSPDCAPEAVAKAKEGAERGEAPSLYLMARYYSTGKCLPGDWQKSAEYYQKALRLKYPPAFYDLGMIVAASQDFRSAEGLFARGMELGHRGSELQLGILYSLAPPPVGDDIKAFALLSITANRAEPVAKEAKDRLDVVTGRLSPEALAQAKARYAKLKEQYEASPKVMIHTVTGQFTFFGGEIVDVIKTEGKNSLVKRKYAYEESMWIPSKHLVGISAFKSLSVWHGEKQFEVLVGDYLATYHIKKDGTFRMDTFELSVDDDGANNYKPATYHGQLYEAGNVIWARRKNVPAEFFGRETSHMFWLQPDGTLCIPLHHICKN